MTTHGIFGALIQSRNISEQCAQGDFLDRSQGPAAFWYQDQFGSFWGVIVHQSCCLQKRYARALPVELGCPDVPSTSFPLPQSKVLRLTQFWFHVVECPDGWIQHGSIYIYQLLYIWYKIAKWHITYSQSQGPLPQNVERLASKVLAACILCTLWTSNINMDEAPLSAWGDVELHVDGQKDGQTCGCFLVNGFGPCKI